MVKNRPAIFGEVLFDYFPDGQRILGGAPFNVAWHLQAFKQRPKFISRIGADQSGCEVSKAMDSWGMDRTSLQIDPVHPTGKVQAQQFASALLTRRGAIVTDPDFYQSYIEDWALA